MPESLADITPRQAFFSSIAIFVAAVVAVVVLWILIGPWLAVIALGVAFFGVFALLLHSLKRLSEGDGGGSSSQ